MTKVETVTVFISRESPTGQYVSKQVSEACYNALGSRCRIRIIDIAEHPDLAERYNIEALPTITLGEKRLVGMPNAETLGRLFGTR